MLDRRQFIKQSVAWSGCLLLPSCLHAPRKGLYRVFTEEEAGCLIALCEQVIPADDTPGATEAGVVFYIDTTVSHYFPLTTGMYKSGIASLQTYCRSEYGNLFETLEPSRQTEIMKAMEAGELPSDAWSADVSQQSFMSMLVQHTMQGFYGPPRHGGNRHYVSYRMLKLDFPLVAGQNRYGNG
ncbi:MAG: gluconate 2-dehydrogenase subunit 3 family protein [Tannerellaceae bacterium]|jgi:gluconate 2-dehydrogenase gamma chain|nr:gluconate 2-dehydrogenase subunit 3 family protein [Tannerellaceae bacterium]